MIAVFETDAVERIAGERVMWREHSVNGRTVTVYRVIGEGPRQYVAAVDGVELLRAHDWSVDALNAGLEAARGVYGRGIAGVATTQECRDCGQLFPYNPDADRCPQCVAEMLGEDEGCPGHPAGPYDPMGQTVYCDGSCVVRA
jgi:predicted Zn-ribbon and HTH transcriptional regulator